MKAPSRHKSSLSGSFRQVSRVGLTLQLRGTAPSDEDGLFNATARDRRRGCLRCNSRENHGSDGVPFLHNAVLLSTIISLNLRGVALHRGGRAGHRSTRVKSRRYATRASQVDGCPFNARYSLQTGTPAAIEVSGEPGITIRWAAGRNQQNTKWDELLCSRQARLKPIIAYANLCTKQTPWNYSATCFGNVMAHVVLRVGENVIESVITRRSAEELKLTQGDTVTAIIKATEVMIQTD